MKSHDVTPTRAWVLHPDIKADPDRRPGEPALKEAVALAAALFHSDQTSSDCVIAVASGGNVDRDVFERALNA